MAEKKENVTTPLGGVYQYIFFSCFFISRYYFHTRETSTPNEPFIKPGMDTALLHLLFIQLMCCLPPPFCLSPISYICLLPPFLIYTRVPIVVSALSLPTLPFYLLSVSFVHSLTTPQIIFLPFLIIILIFYPFFHTNAYLILYLFCPLIIFPFIFCLLLPFFLSLHHKPSSFPL